MIRRRSLLKETTGGEFIEGFIILDQTKSDPTQKVVDMTGNTYSSGYVRPAVIDAIRAASHCYVGTYDSTNQKMSLKQLNDGNHTLYADGTIASGDITSKDVFMRLPFFFTRATQPETNKWKIEFAYDPNQTVSTTATPSGSGWMKWGGTDLIGKYEASSSSIYSRSGKSPESNQSYNSAVSTAKAKGTGYGLVKWRNHCVMAILFYAYYGHTNCQELCGSGSSSSSRTTGQKNTFGMTDTDSTNGNTNSIVFWGLENWWGGRVEQIEDIRADVNSATKVVTLTFYNADGTTQRTKTFSYSGSSTERYPVSLQLGDYLDILPVNGTTAGSSSQGYCDATYFQTSSSTSDRTGRRSSFGNNADGGVAFLNIAASKTNATTQGARLAYTGPMEIVPQQEVNDFVDLGLPSGRKWAKGNIVSDGNGGYKIGNETDYGAYFSWGNIEPHFSTNGTTFDDGYSFNDTAYSSTPGASLTADIPSNDSAHDACVALLGEPWHLPMKDDYLELYANTDREWTTINGINGWKFMKKSDHSVYVFFPTGGLSDGRSIGTHVNAAYWSSSFNGTYAYRLYFESSSISPQGQEPRWYGLSVRAIR